MKIKIRVLVSNVRRNAKERIADRYLKSMRVKQWAQARSIDFPGPIGLNLQANEHFAVVRFKYSLGVAARSGIRHATPAPCRFSFHIRIADKCQPPIVR
jgi:hypothetical protein